tara:strand:- start:140 stop:502 length:363 start_codon:yes stop_codon:yes gene_type:complete
MLKNLINAICIFVIIVLLSDSGAPLVSKPDMVAVVYESSDDIPEPYVTGALNKLTAEGFQSRIFDKDVVTGGGEIPSQIKNAITAANNNGLPALVILGNGKVISVQDLPKTEQQIMEAAQ